jgi:hypothetical protein
MGQAIVFGAIAVILLIVIYILGKEKAAVVRHSNSGIFMRALNKKGGRRYPEKCGRSQY